MSATTDIQPSNARLQHILLIGAGLMLVATMAAFALAAFAIQQRAIDPPRFSVHIGNIQYGAPCPSPAFNCDVHLNYYAVWRGQQLPNGTVHFTEVYFTWLPRKR